MITGGDSTVRAALAVALEELGVDISNTFVCLDVPSGPDLLQLPRLPRRSRVLISFEPSVIQPLSHSAIFTSLFEHRILVGNREQGVPWPYSVTKIRHSDRDRLQKTIIIQADKLSMVSGELYSLRRQAIDSSKVEFFGPGWETRLLPRVRPLLVETLRAAFSLRLATGGARGFLIRRSKLALDLPDKLRKLSDYTVALVIENSLETWTEKLPDALASGCIPVYVGPELPDEFFDENTYIRAEPNIHSVIQALERAHAIDHVKYLEENSSVIIKKLSKLSEALSYQAIAREVARVL